MSKYVEGFYKVKVDEEKFNACKELKYQLDLLSGLYQNDMTITHEDLENMDTLVKELYLNLMSDFEDHLENNVEYLGKEI